MDQDSFPYTWVDIEGGDGLQGAARTSGFVLVRRQGKGAITMSHKTAAALSTWIDGLTVADTKAEPTASEIEIPPFKVEAPADMPTGPLLARVAERLRAEIRKEFGTDWSIDVAENFASVAIDECYRARREAGAAQQAASSPEQNGLRPPAEHARWISHHLRRDPSRGTTGHRQVLCWDGARDVWYPAGTPSCPVLPHFLAAHGWHYVGPVRSVLFGADQPVQAAAASDGAALPGKMEWQAEADRLTKREQLRLIEIAKNLPHDDPMRRLAVDLLTQSIHPEMKAPR